MTYISKEKLVELEAELEHRKKVLRREIAEKISSARELGDLSENFEYHEAKDQQGQNESQIARLDMMIKDAVLVTERTGGIAISIGSTFVVEVDGQKKTFEIVGSSEAHPLEGKISNESPLGNAFLGHGPGEEVEVETQSGKKVYKILEIK